MNVEHDYEKLLELLNDALAPYEKSVTARAGMIWFEALKHYSLAEVAQGLTAHIANPEKGQFAPKPADVIANIDLTTEALAMAAWAKVDRSVKMVGAYRSIVFDDPIIHVVIVDLGGWIKLCQTNDEKDFGFIGADFRKRYTVYMRHPPDVYPGLLVGLTQLHNESNKLKLPFRQAPALVGNTARAREVLLNGSEEAVQGLAQKQPAIESRRGDRPSLKALLSSVVPPAFQ